MPFEMPDIEHKPAERAELLKIVAMATHHFHWLTSHAHSKDKSYYGSEWIWVGGVRLKVRIAVVNFFTSHMCKINCCCESLVHSCKQRGWEWLFLLMASFHLSCWLRSMHVLINIHPYGQLQTGKRYNTHPAFWIGGPRQLCSCPPAVHKSLCKTGNQWGSDNSSLDSKHNRASPC